MNTLDVRDYLCVDEFLRDFVSARALTTAFEFRLIDWLVANHGVSIDGLASQFKGDKRGLRLLLDLLKANGVVAESSGYLSLTGQFRHALLYRDLLEAKLAFANFAARDFDNCFSLMVSNPTEFMRRASMLKLFDYSRAMQLSPENYEATKRWMQFTTVLTRYEAGVCASVHDFSKYRRLLDVGGNSGEFALQLCRRNPQLNATVLDLPVVCEVGRNHIAGHPEESRISFLPGSAITTELPTRYDIITFKSMLHDWPDREVRLFVERAINALAPGGTLFIFERQSLDVSSAPPPFSLLPMLLFARSFREPQWYSELMSLVGFHPPVRQIVELETPFLLIYAIKPSL